jgi:hypothetical protein
MTVRTPLKLDGTDFKEMSTAEITAIKNQCRYLYGLNPPVTLLYAVNSGNLGNIADTRMKAGAGAVDATNFDTAAETPNISQVTVNNGHINQFIDTSITAEVDNHSKKFPVYYSGGTIQAMTQTDFFDTFIYDAIDTLTNGTDQPGTYRAYSIAGLSGHDLIDTRPIFVDTIANVSAFTAAGIYEGQDQFSLNQYYFLLKTQSGPAQSYPKPLHLSVDSNSVIQEYSTSEFDGILSQMVRYAAANKSGTRIRYSLNGLGNNRGSGMVDTRLNGSGNYQTRFVGANDYRSQEFPNGTQVTANTHRLRIYQA